MNTPTDPRLRRPRDDAMPTHRQCSKCLQVQPLDPEHFYVKRAAYEWQLSRFMPYCIECDRARVREYYRANRAKRNARSAEAHRIARANAKELGGPARLEAQRIAQAAKAAEEQVRKQRKAQLKRQMLKRYGPRPDGVKALIRSRVEMYFRRRLSSPEEPRDFKTPVRDWSRVRPVRKTSGKLPFPRWP